MLKSKFLFPLLLLVTLAIFSVGTLTFIRTSKALQAAALVDMQRSAVLLKNSSEVWLKNRYADIGEISQSDIFLQSTGDSFLSVSSRQVASKRLTETTVNSEFYKRFVLVNRAGIILASSRHTDGEVLSSEYKQFVDDTWDKMTGPGKVESVTQWQDGSFRYIVGTRLFREDKINQTIEPLDGMLIAEINVQALINSTFASLSFGHSGYASLYDENNHNLNTAPQVKLALDNPNDIKAVPVDPAPLSGDDSVTVTKLLELVPWSIGVTIKKKEFTAPAYRIAYDIVSIGLIVTGCAALLILVFLTWILKPIQALAATAAAITRSKDYSLRAKKHSNDELGMLVGSFNEMLTQIETRDHNLEEAAHKLETALHVAEDARVKADTANQAKTEFLANMSHELRTPLNSIVGLTDILVEEHMLPEHLEMVGIVKKSSAHLLEIVNDILELSKIENLGVKLVLEAVPFDFNKSITEIIEVLAPLASQKGIALRYKAGPSIPYIVGDPTRVKRILMNLVSNAIKYTLVGSVDVIVAHRLLEDGRTEVCVNVKDTGIGIPEEKFDKIFEKFTQADESTTRKFGGTGLGLTICKSLVEMMGGRIGVTSQVNVGSTFHFCVPFATTDKLDEIEGQLSADGTPVPVANRVPLEKARILVADDSELNKVYIKKLFSTLGAAIPDIASDGQEAFDMWKAGEYDMVLMDCHMPRISGYDAVVMIRQAEAPDKHVPVIAMTADVMSGTREKCAKAGMDDYISKPVDKNKFVALLSRWIIFPGQQAKAAQAAVVAEAEEAPPISLSYVHEFSGGDPDAEREFVAVFIDESDKSIAVLKENRTDGHNKEWSETMHHLKNSFGLMGSDSLRALCEKGQHMIEGTAEERIALFDDIIVAYEAVRAYLKKIYP